MLGDDNVIGFNSKPDIKKFDDQTKINFNIECEF